MNRMWRTLLAALPALLLLASPLRGQENPNAIWAQLKGYVYEEETGMIVPLATVALEGTTLGSVTNDYGFFLIRKIPAGEYTVVVRCVGFKELREKLVVTKERVESRIFRLTRMSIELEAATITSARRRWERMIPAGQQRMTVETMERTPSLGVQSDLAQVLQTLPGVIYTGDRGGQLYVRGGAPVHNKVLLDGMTVVNPFHSIGFMSVFDTDILQSVDVYSAAYGAEYGGRVSSIMDLRTRPGNPTEMRGKISESNIGYGMLLEGPLRKMDENRTTGISYILSTKGSTVRSTAPVLYPWLDSLGLPYRYGDYYGKISFMERNGNRFDIFGLHYSDEVKYRNAISNRWNTTGGGFGFVISPAESNFLFVNRLAMSRYNSFFDDPATTPKSTVYDNLDMSIKGIHVLDHFQLVWAAEFTSIHTRYTYTRWDGLHFSDDMYTSDAIILFQAKIIRPRWILEPGLHLRVYSSLFSLHPEPRLKFRFNFSDNLSLNLAGGLYSQNLIAVSSEHDVVSLFQGYYTGVDQVQSYLNGERIYKPIQESWHAVAGLNWFDDRNLKISLEAYVKDFYRLIDYNNHQVYKYTGYDPEVPEYLSSPYIFESGWAYGLDFLLDYSDVDYSLWLAYSFAYVTREDEFLKYVPHFDRRHNLNFLANYRFGKNRSWTAKMRWQIGSGFPFTQTAGFYEEYKDQTGTFLLDPTGEGGLAILFGPINEGRLPAYHRLDLSLSRTWKFPKGREIEMAASVMNVYNRKNVFYYDRITQTRIDQLPVMPTIGLVFKF